jgi:epoxyqueuosine reductase
VRNVLIAIGNSGEAALAAEADRLLGDASPLVRGAAVWALSQLKTADEFNALAERAIEKETNEEVQHEWRHVS